MDADHKLVAVGAPDRGLVYLATYDQGALVKVDSISGSAAGKFGEAVALEGNYLVVGAPAATAGSIPNSGAVFLYEKEDAGWSLKDRVSRPEPMHGDRFGDEVDLQNGQLVVGAWGSDSEAKMDRGGVFVYDISGAPALVLSKMIADPGSSMLGWDVALAGNLVAASSMLSPQITLSVDGASANVTLTGRTPTEFPGFALAAEDDLLAVSVPSAESGTGAVHLFRRSGSSYVGEAVLTDPAASHLGRSLDILNGVVMAGGEPGTAPRIFWKAAGAWKSEVLGPATVPASERGYDVALSEAGAFQSGAGLLVRGPSPSRPPSAPAIAVTVEGKTPVLTIGGDADRFVIFRSKGTSSWSVQDTTTSEAWSEPASLAASSDPYVYRVQAISAYEVPSAFSDPKPVVIEASPPPAPQGLQASLSPYEISLSWDEAPDAESYYIYRDGDLAGTTGETTWTEEVNASSQHDYWVRAATTAAGKGAPSNTAHVTTPSAPNAPSQLAASMNGHALELTWEGPEGAFYAISRSGVALDTTTSQALTDNSVKEKATYTYHVKAIGEWNLLSDPSAVSFTVPDQTKPASPASLLASAGEASIEVSWQAATSPDVERYRLYRRAGPVGEFTLMANIDALQATDIDVSLDIAYYYKVTAVDSSGHESAASTAASATLEKAPEPIVVRAPQTVEVALSPNLATVTWDASEGAEKYVVYRNGTALDTVTTLTYEDATVQAAGEYGYWIEPLSTEAAETEVSNPVQVTMPDVPRAPSGLSASAEESGVQITWEGPENASFIVFRGNIVLDTTTTSQILDDDVQEGRAYTYAVKSLGRWGLTSDAATVSLTVPAPESPLPPRGLAATTSRGVVALSWQASSSDAIARYRVYRRKGEEGDWTLLQETGSLSAMDNEVEEGLTYFYHVTAVGAHELESKRSALASVNITPAPPASPKNLRVRLSPYAAALTWDKAEGANGYVVSRGELVVDTVEAVQYEDNTLKAGSTYSYSVRSVSGSRLSEPGNTVSVTTPAPPTAPLELKASVKGRSIHLIWKGTGDVRYVVRRGKTIVDTTRQTNYTDGGVADGKTYSYAVWSVGAWELKSPVKEVSAKVKDQTPPKKPQRVLASVSKDKSVLISWDKPTERVKSFRVYRRNGENSHELKASVGMTWKVTSTLSAEKNSVRDTTTEAGHTYFYRVTAVDEAGNESIDVMEMKVVIPLDKPYRLVGPYPNPSAGEKKVKITLKEQGDVQLQLYDVAGRLVRERSFEGLSANQEHLVKLSGNGLATGMFILVVRGEGFRAVKKLTHTSGL